MAPRKSFSLDDAFKIAILIIGFFCAFLIYDIKERLLAIEYRLNTAQMDLTGITHDLSAQDARLTKLEKK